MKDYLVERSCQSSVIVAAPNTVICHHPFTVGSSAVHRLFQRTYQLNKAHQRAFYHGVHGDGAFWEDYVYKWTSLECTAFYNIQEKHSQVTGLSSRYPWLVATPDFIFKLENAGRSFYACIEVKSTTSELTFKHVPQEFIVQLQTALEVFNLKKGFLVMLHVDHNSKELLNSKVIAVQCAKTFDDKNEVVSAYAYYLQNCIKDTLGCVVELDYLCDNLYPLVGLQNKSAAWDSHIVRLPRYTKCKALVNTSANKRLVMRKMDGPCRLTGDYSARGYSYRDGANVYK